MDILIGKIVPMKLPKFCLVWGLTFEGQELQIARLVIIQLELMISENGQETIPKLKVVLLSIAI